MWNLVVSVPDHCLFIYFSFSYCLVTFKAAIQYMTSTNFDKLDLSKNLVENEISIDDLMAAKWEKSISPTLEEDHSIDNLSSRPRAQSKNRLEHRLDSITKMLEESAKELTTSPREIPDVQATTSIFGEKNIEQGTAKVTKGHLCPSWMCPCSVIKVHHLHQECLGSCLLTELPANTDQITQVCRMI